MSTKHTEIGIGQASFTAYRYKLVDYLPWMYIYEFPFHCQLPKEVGSYLTLIRPFDEYTWILAFVASTIFCITLVVMEPLWTDQPISPFESDFLYQGIHLCEVTLFIRKLLFSKELCHKLIYRFMHCNILD